MKSNPDNQHSLQSLSENDINASSSDEETPINKTSLNYDDLLELQFMTELDLSNKQLTSLPSEIGNFSDLTHLYLHNNNFKELPKEIIKLTKLMDLTLHKNPNLIFTDEQNIWLEQLQVNGCKVTGVEPIIPTDQQNIWIKLLQIYERKFTEAKPKKTEQAKQKPKNIPTLNEWMDDEKKKFAQDKAQ